MKLICLIALGVACAAAADISVARCRRTFISDPENRYVGQAGWENKAAGGMLGTTENGTTGRAAMTCVVKLSQPATEAVLDFGGAHVSFTGPKGDATPSGLAISAPSCELSAIRVTREDWIELGPASYLLPLGASTDRVTISFTLVDASRSAAVRADVKPLRIRLRRPGEEPRSCPPVLSR